MFIDSVDYFDRQSFDFKFGHLYTYKPPTNFEVSKYKLYVHDHRPVQIEYLYSLRKSFSLSCEDTLFIIPDTDDIGKIVWKD